MGCKRQTHFFSGKTKNSDFLKILLLTLVLSLTFSNLLYAQGSGRVVSIQREVEPTKFMPYFVATVGANQPHDRAFNVFGDEVLVGLGGGIGFKYEKFGVELYYRIGSAQQVFYVDSDNQTGVQRNIELSESKLQARFFYHFDVGNKISFPAGLGIGLTKSTVDRGYTGIFDRFNGNGLNISPFVGIEYPMLKGIYISAEFEYMVNVVSYQGSHSWYNQYKDGDITNGEFTIFDDPNGDYKFWDQVGGPNDTEFDFGGVAFHVRLRFDLPIYRQSN